MSKTILYQVIQFCITTQFTCQNSSISRSQNIKTALFQVIPFIISWQFSSMWLIDRTLSGTTTSSQSGPGGDDNEGKLCIPQSSSITGASPSDCLVSYTGHSLDRWGSYSSAEMHSIYSIATAIRATTVRVSPSVANSILIFFIALVIKVTTCSEILYIFRHSIIQFYGIIIIITAIFVVVVVVVVVRGGGGSGGSLVLLYLPIQLYLSLNTHRPYITRS